MAAVLNRTTKEFIRFANTPDYSTTDWIINPDLSAVVGFASKYWTITGDVVTLMDQAARDAVDVQEASDSFDSAVANVLDPIASSDDNTGVMIRTLVEFVNKRDNYIINRLTELQTALLDAKATSGGADNIRNAIPASFMATSTRTKPTAMSDFKAIAPTVTDPE